MGYARRKHAQAGVGGGMHSRSSGCVRLFAGLGRILRVAAPAPALVCICALRSLCLLYRESSKRLAPPRNTKDRKHPESSKRPSTDTTHRPSTRHYRNGSPGVKTHNTNHHSSRARLQHSNHPPSLPTPNWVITRSSQLTQRSAQAPGGPSSGVADGQPRAPDEL